MKTNRLSSMLEKGRVSRMVERDRKALEIAGGRDGHSSLCCRGCLGPKGKRSSRQKTMVAVGSDICQLEGDGGDCLGSAMRYYRRV
jgi:hypothetical protein